MVVKGFVLAVLVWAGSLLPVSARLLQSDSTIVSHLRDNRSGGKVVIHQSKKLEAKLGRQGIGSTVSRVRDVNYLVTQGYRIQIFSGNSQKKSKAEAARKEQMVKQLDPTLETYVTFDSPFWRLRVGNYRSHEEAELRLRVFRKEFPSFGKEMYVVPDVVQFPIEDL